MKINFLFFDADGVIQKNSINLVKTLKSLINNKYDKDNFLNDVFNLEKQCLIGKDDFSIVVSNLLNKWNINKPLIEILDYWNMIVPDKEIIYLIKKLRIKYKVVLLTNQQRYRAEYMDYKLKYNKMFDYTFYSYNLGVMKPNKEFYLKVIKSLNCSENSILYFDDNIENIQRAKEIGINAEIFNITEGVEKLHLLLNKYNIYI